MNLQRRRTLERLGTFVALFRTFVRMEKHVFFQPIFRRANFRADGTEKQAVLVVFVFFLHMAHQRGFAGKVFPAFRAFDSI